MYRDYRIGYTDKFIAEKRLRKERLRRRAHAASVSSRWRGNIPIPEHAHPLIRELIEAMNTKKMTLSELALKAGFRRGTISEWRYRGNPRVPDLEAALNVLGLELTIRRRGKK